MKRLKNRNKKTKNRNKKIIKIPICIYKKYKKRIDNKSLLTLIKKI